MMDNTLDTKNTGTESHYWSLLLDSSFDEIYVFNANDLKFSQVSRSALQNLGYTLEEMTRLTPVDIKPDINLQQFKALIQPLVSGKKKQVVFAARHKRKDGSVYPVEVRLQLSRGNEQPVFIAIILNTTEKLESDLRYRALDQAALVGIFRTSVDGKCLFVNDRWCELANMSREKSLQDGWVDALHPEDRERIQVEWQEYIQGKQHFRQEFRLLDRKTGKVTWVLSQAVPDHDIDGKAIAHTGTVTDITEQKETENAIKQIASSISAHLDDDFFRSLISTLAELLGASYAMIGLIPPDNQDTIKTFIVYDHGRIVDNFSYDLADTPCENVIGNVTCIYPSAVQKLFPNDKMLQDMGVESYIGTPINKPDGTPMGLIAVLDSKPLNESKVFLPIFDIFATRCAVEILRIQAEDELRAQRNRFEEQVASRTAELSRANEELKAFAYSVSHDLRAPLRSIEGFGRLLLDEYFDKVDKDGKDYLNRIRKASQRMSDLIDHMLVLSRVSSSELHMATVNLSDIAHRITEKYREAEPERKLEFKIEPDLVATGDRTLLENVLENLIGNAVKYTRETEKPLIELGQGYKNNEHYFFIRDNGTGFSMTYADKLFVPFQRLHGSDYEGSGIGLATVARIVYRHGGRVWADSVLNEGATFYFTLSQDQ